MNDLSSYFLKWTNGLSYIFKNETKVCWNIEDAQAEDIVVYFLHHGQEAQTKLAERLKNKKFKLLVLNRFPTQELNQEYVVIQSDWSEFQKGLADCIWPIPSRLKIIGITGTNGKTTTTDFALQLASQNKIKAISIGTLGVRSSDGKTVQEFNMTTPGFLQLRNIIFTNAHDCELLIMEVSSHALDQKRVFGLKFSAAAWMSFSQDHLDYHLTLENYFNAKSLIFKYLPTDVKLVVPDSQEDLLIELNKNFSDKIEKIQTRLNDTTAWPAFLKISYNQDNINVACKLLLNCGYKIKLDVHKILPPPGRFWTKELSKNRYIVVDFAHTPDALYKVCHALVTSFPQKKLEVIFGCGGDRDRLKRPLMAKAAEELASKIWLTSDNPRSEEPLKIIQDIEQGIQNKDKCISNPDRRAVIKEAIYQLKPDHMLLIAGKGHENYLEIKGVKYPYSDIEEVQKNTEGVI